MSDLYPTKTRLELLRAVAEERVIEGIHDEHTWLLDGPYEPRKVDARVQELLTAGWADLAEPWVTWRLTDAGRAVLDAREVSR